MELTYPRELEKKDRGWEEGGNDPSKRQLTYNHTRLLTEIKYFCLNGMSNLPTLEEEKYKILKVAYVYMVGCRFLSIQQSPALFSYFVDDFYTNS